ncbi:hypothetical protein PI124_g6985 [Phytophthora idaei]|nr:hypothetical protein PI125_g6644 [Phytophthora idaei]KAG3161546.1 hypothetical protein PI126_g6383 [Phytophthora idaei]KAG3248336.1 hypothetical protein PI124_g6985 [Phytophthora idaei]
MLQGLKNSLATFNRTIVNLLRTFRDFAPTYFGDIFSPCRAEGDMTDVEVHLQHLRQMPQVMGDSKPHANLKKCIICAPETPVLGSYVSTEGFRRDLDKVEVICALSTS